MKRVESDLVPKLQSQMREVRNSSVLKRSVVTGTGFIKGAWKLRLCLGYF